MALPLAMLFMVYLCPMHCHAQAIVADIEKKLTSLKDGKGYLIEDFSYFQKEVVDKIAGTASSMQKQLDESLRKRVDSLYGLLKQNRAVSMPTDDIALVKHFPGVDEGPRVIANLVFTLPRLGGSKSLEYAVQPGDTVDIEYFVLRGRGFDEIEVLEGKEVRFNAARNTKNELISTQILIETKGIIVVNLTNKAPIPSKGKLLITVRPALLKLTMQYLCDTLTNVVKTKVTLVDTLPETLFSKSLRLTPRTNITSSPRITIDIPIPQGRNYLAWGYWVGTQENSFKAWRTLASADTLRSPLAPYLSREMVRRDRRRLPLDDHRDLRFSIRYGDIYLHQVASSLAAASNPTDPVFTDIKPNYGSIAIRDPASAPLSIGIELENLSKVYSCQAQVDIVALYSESREEEREWEEKTCREYVKISIQ